ncbi:caspase family protein [Streptomyces sp. NPDC049590]|uniref:wHTH domain-containing protein n=1 Tax=Streptomyces sp. NPDC049590 TaxID=3154834 RepID=UPI0034257F99
MTAGRRRALLIAVPGYPQLERVEELKGRFPGLPFTAKDAATLRATLLRSGYRPEHVTVLDDEDATGEGGIRDELGRFLNSLEDGDTGLVYFTGHGVRSGEKDYLVPSDIRAGWGRAGERTLGPHGLIEVAPDELLAPLRSSATVMLCLDACRSGGDVPPPAFDTLTMGRPWDNVVLLSACSPGEEALGHPDAGSVLAMALSETLAPESSARTFRQVIERVKRRAEEIAAGYTHRRPPTVSSRWLGEDLSGGAHADAVLCEAIESAGPWTDAVLRSALWERTDGTTPAQRGRAKEQLSQVVTKTVALRALREPEADPWDDPLVPRRLIERLDHLVEAAGARLSLIETVVLLGAPFLREAALSCGLAALRTLHGDGPDHAAPARELPEDSFPAHLDRDMADVRRAHRQIEATRRILLRRGHEADARSAEYWLRHRFLADWDLLWEQRGDAELDSLRAAVDLLVRAAESAAGLTLGTEERGVLRRAVVHVVSQLGTGTPAGTVAPDGAPWDTDLCAYLCGEADRWSWRPRELATLLHLAGLLAIDPRQLDGVLVDHLGPRAPTQVRPAGIKEEIAANDGFRPAGGAWPPGNGTPGPAPGTVWRLVFKCSGPALFTALDRLATRIAAVSDATRRAQGALRPGDLLYGLPQLVKTEGLLPRNRGFDKPPPRFRLAEDEVKPLIMGTQLYGDRMLAVRELYQNALDACRVRQARRRYAEHAPAAGARTEREQLDGSHIVFTQGTDPDTGRTYIQCEDNGVGMTAEELRDLFAQAGRRSEQSAARMREMRRWRRRGVTTELNSRFGIGVFSYFMLAEEIEVTTRPVNTSGLALDGHRAGVTAGSGLMHLVREYGELLGGGTRVRLYLHDDPEERDEGRPSLIAALREFLWVSPVRVTATEYDGDPAEWQPGELYGDSSLLGAPIAAGEDVWWVRGKGMLLADGLLVSKAERPQGYVVNLRGRHRPELSVDRNRLLGCDEHRVEEDLKGAIPTLVGSAWRPFPLEWLWDLATSRPRIAQDVVAGLMADDVRVSVPVREAVPDREWPVVALREAGCLPSDADLVTGKFQTDDPDLRFFVGWRFSVLGTGRQPLTLPLPAGLPRPEPIDAVLHGSAPARSLRGPLRTAAVTGRSLREVTRRLRRYAVVGAWVPDAADVRALADFEPSRLAATLYDAFEHAVGQAVWETDEDPHYELRQALVRVSAEEKAGLGVLAELFTRLSRLDPSVPAPSDLREFGSHRVDARERRVLLHDWTDDPEADLDALPLPVLVRPADVARRAFETGIPPAEIEDIVRRYAPLGYRLAGPEVPYPLDESQLTALSRDLDALPPFLPPHPVGLRHLVRLAARRRETVGSAAGWLAEWAGPFGVEVADPGPLAGFAPPAWCGRLAVQQPGAQDRAMSAWQLLRVLINQADPVAEPELVAVVGTLADAGLVERRAVDVARVWCAAPLPAGYRLRQWQTSPGRRRHVVTFAAPTGIGRDGRMRAAALVAMATAYRESLGAAVDLLRRQADAYGFGVPDVPGEAAGLKPDGSVRDRLCEGDGWRPFISLTSLADFADIRDTDLATAAAELNAYAPLGAPTVPVRPGFVPPAEPGERDTAAELALLQSCLDDSWTLPPLGLVVAAARLGEGLRETYRRLGPFTGLGLELPYPEPGCDRVPDWRDVVLLTARLTGRDPVLSGEVGAGHLELAAEETELTVDEVRARLADYAPLFGFRLPPHERS